MDYIVVIRNKSLKVYEGIYRTLSTLKAIDTVYDNDAEYFSWGLYNLSNRSIIQEFNSKNDILKYIENEGIELTGNVYGGLYTIVTECLEDDGIPQMHSEKRDGFLEIPIYASNWKTDMEPARLPGNIDKFPKDCINIFNCMNDVAADGKLNNFSISVLKMPVDDIFDEGYANAFDDHIVHWRYYSNDKEQNYRKYIALNDIAKWEIFKLDVSTTDKWNKLNS